MPGYLLYEILLVVLLATCICEVGKLMLPSRSIVRTNTVVDMKLQETELRQLHMPLIEPEDYMEFQDKDQIKCIFLWHLDPLCTGINGYVVSLAVKSQAFYLRLPNNSVSNYSPCTTFN